MFRKQSGEEAGPTQSDPEPTLRAPAVRGKFACALGALAELEEQVAEYALEAAERKPGAADKLAGHRAKIEAAQTAVDELRAALRLAEKLDRQAAAAGAVRMRNEQFTALKQQFAAREKAAKAVMKAVTDLSDSYGKFSECSLGIISVLPSGAVLPTMSMGPNGIFGPALGPCGQLILAELWRVAPERRDGTGRFVLPFVKVGIELLKDVSELPVGIDELRTADQAILANISEQIEHLNETALRAADIHDAALPAALINEDKPRSLGEALVELAQSQPDTRVVVPPPLPEEKMKPRQAAGPLQPTVPAFDAFTMSDADAIVGISADDCCKACSEKGCVLTGGIRCSHPMKGGLAKGDLLRPDVVNRYAAACTSAGLKNIHAPEPEVAA